MTDDGTGGLIPDSNDKRMAFKRQQSVHITSEQETLKYSQTNYGAMPCQLLQQGNRFTIYVDKWTVMEASY